MVIPPIFTIWDNFQPSMPSGARHGTLHVTQENIQVLTIKISARHCAFGLPVWIRIHLCMYPQHAGCPSHCVECGGFGVHTCEPEKVSVSRLFSGRSVVPFFACWCHNVAWNLLQGRIGAQAAWFRLWSCRARKTFSLSMSQPWECGAWELGTQRGMCQCSHVQPTANELCMVLHRASHLCLNLFPRWRPWAWFPS